MVRIYTDTNVLRYFGEAFATSTVPKEIAIQLFLAPLAALELLSQLGTKGAESAFAAVRALPRVHNPAACGVLPWTDDFFRICLFKQQPEQDNITQSNCNENGYGFEVCTESGTFSGPTLNNGTYWLNLLNATVNNGDPVYWDENSGIGCQSEGCPSQACEGNCESTIPSESFSILGTSSGTGTVPEPSSLALVGCGLFAVDETLRRRFYL